MLTGIHWAQFIEFTGGAALAYYLVIILMFYRGSIHRVTAAFQKKPPVEKNDRKNDDEASDVLMPQVYELMHSIKETLQRAAAQKHAPAETVFALQQITREYPAVKASRFAAAINDEIIQLSNELLGQPFTDDELTAIWN